MSRQDTLMSVRPEVRAARAYHFTPRPAAVKLDQNESPYDLPPELKRKVWERLQEIPWNRYSELAAESLRAAVMPNCPSSSSPQEARNA